MGHGGHNCANYEVSPWSVSYRSAYLLTDRASRQRKRLPHAQLVAEVISQLANRFTPEVSFIKGRIEALIEREYLERIDEGHSAMAVYNYLA